MIAFLKRHIRRIWTAAPFATALLALALAAVLLFGVRSTLFWTHRHERIAREQPVAAWMTPRYVVLSWQVPRTVVIDTLALDPWAGPPRETLADLAAQRGVPVESLIAALETAIAEHRAAHPDPDRGASTQRDAHSDPPGPGDEASTEPAADPEVPAPDPVDERDPE